MNIILADKRIVIKELEEDLYDGQVLSILMGKKGIKHFMLSRMAYSKAAILYNFRKIGKNKV